MNMSSKPKGNGSTAQQGTPAQAMEDGGHSMSVRARDEDIRRRAHEIYLERGEQPGRDLDHWFQAERELERGIRSRAQAG